jgi:hypothetical protein
MSTGPTRSDQSGETDPILAELAEGLAKRLRAGEAVDVETFLREHPEHAVALRQLLPTI